MQLRHVLTRFRRLLDPDGPSALTDAQLIRSFVACRDEAAFAALVERHGGMVLSVCRRVLHDPQDVDDAFQATFLVLIEKAASLGSPELVGNWLYGVAYRVAQKARQAAARRQHHERQAGEMTRPTSAAVAHELGAVLDDEVNRLPDKYRTPLVLCYLEGKTNEETARDLGWPVGTVSGRLARARDLLRARLTRRGLALSAAALSMALAEQAATAVPAATVRALAAASARGADAARGFSQPIVNLARGVERDMWYAKLKALLLVVTVVALTGVGIGLLGQGLSVAVPVGEPPRAVLPPSIPAGVPLEVKLIARQDKYALELGGRTEAEFKKVVEGPAFQELIPKVELAVEVRNTGKQELKIWQVGGPARFGDHQLGFEFLLDGPGAIVRRREPVHANTIFRPRDVVTLPPAKSHVISVRNLSFVHCRVAASEVNFGSACWSQAGKYQLSTKLHLAVSPVPRDSEPTHEGSEYGYVTLTSNSIELEVTAPK